MFHGIAYKIYIYIGRVNKILKTCCQLDDVKIKIKIKKNVEIYFVMGTSKIHTCNVIKISFVIIMKI